MNSIVRAHREKYPQDPRNDAAITLAYGEYLEQNNLFDTQADDFRTEFRDVQRRLRPGLVEEAGRGLSRGIDMLQGTAYGGLALAADTVGAEPVADWAMEGYQRNMQEAGENAPSVKSYRDIENVSDAFNYGAGRLGEVLPSIGESVVSGVAGAALGSAAPGAGTVAGGIAGLGSKAAVRGLIQSQIRSKLGKEIAEEAASEIAERAVQSGTRKAFANLTEELIQKGTTREVAEQIAQSARRRAAAASGAARFVIADSIFQNAGSTYGEILAEGGDVSKWDAIGNAYAAGTISGALDAALPLVVVRKLFPRTNSNGLKQAMKNAAESAFGGAAPLAKFMTKVGGDLGLEASTESFQELVQAMAVANAENGNLSEAWKSIDKDELREQMINAAITGAIGGTVMGGPINTVQFVGDIRERRNRDTSGLDQFGYVKDTVQNILNEPDDVGAATTLATTEQPATAPAPSLKSTFRRLIKQVDLNKQGDLAAVIIDYYRKGDLNALRTIERVLPYDDQLSEFRRSTSKPAADAIPASGPTPAPEPVSEATPEQVAIEATTPTTETESAALPTDPLQKVDPAFKYFRAEEIGQTPEQVFSALLDNAVPSRTEIDKGQIFRQIAETPIPGKPDTLIPQEIATYFTGDRPSKNRIPRNLFTQVAKDYGLSESEIQQAVDTASRIRENARVDRSRTNTRAAVVLEDTKTGQVETRGVFLRSERGKRDVRVHAPEGATVTLDSLLESGKRIVGKIEFNTSSPRHFYTYPSLAAFNQTAETAQHYSPSYESRRTATESNQPIRQQLAAIEAQLASLNPADPQFATLSQDRDTLADRLQGRITFDPLYDGTQGDPATLDAVYDPQTELTVLDAVDSLYVYIRQAVEGIDQKTLDTTDTLYNTAREALLNDPSSARVLALALEPNFKGNDNDKVERLKIELAYLYEIEEGNAETTAARIGAGQVAANTPPVENGTSGNDPTGTESEPELVGVEADGSATTDAGSTDPESEAAPESIPVVTTPADPEAVDFSGTPVDPADQRINLATGLPQEPVAAPTSMQAIAREVEKAETAVTLKSGKITKAFNDTFGLSDRGIWFLDSILSNLESANPERFARLNVVIGENAPAFMREAQESNSRGAYNISRNTLWVNSMHPENISDASIITVLHELGHFASNYLIPRDILESAWKGLSDFQRGQALAEWRGIRGVGEDALIRIGSRLADLSKAESETAMQEWAAFQFTRIVRAGASDMERTRKRMVGALMKTGLSEEAANTIIVPLMQFYADVRGYIAQLLGESYVVGSDKTASASLDKAVANLFDREGDGQLASFAGIIQGSTLNFPSRSQPGQTVDTLFMPAKRDPERSVRLGLTSYQGYENPARYLSNAWSVWNELNTLRSQLISSVQQQQILQQGDYIRYADIKQPTEIEAFANQRGHTIEKTPLQNITDQRKKEAVAHFAAIEVQQMQEATTGFLQEKTQRLKELQRESKRLIGLKDRAAANGQINELTQLNTQINQLDGRIARTERQVRAYQEMLKTQERQKNKLVAIYGGSVVGQIIRGTHIAVPSDPLVPEVTAVEFDWSKPDQIDGEILAAQAAWLANPTNKDADPFLYNVIKTQRDTLMRMSQEKRSVESRNLLFGWFRPIAQRLRDIGDAAATDASRMTFMFQSIYDSSRNEAENLGRRADLSRIRLMRSIGIEPNKEGLHRFVKLFDSPAKIYMEQDGATYEGLFTFLGKNPIRQEQLSNPEVRRLLREYLELEDQNSKFLRDLTVQYSSVTDTRITVKGPDGQTTRPLERRPIDLGTGTFMTRPDSDMLRRFVPQMEAAWSQPFKQAEDLMQRLPQMFSPQIIKNFLTPLIYKEKAPVFADATPDQVIAAWESSNDNVVQFFTALHQAVAPDQDATAYAIAKLNELQSVYAEAVTVLNAFDTKASAVGSAMAHVGIDARQKDRFPGAWMNYRMAGATTNRHMVSSIAFHSSFGKDGAAFKDRIQAAKQTFTNLNTQWQEILDQTASLTGKARKARQIELAGGAENFRRMRDSYKRVQELDRIEAGFEGVFSSELGPSKEMGPWLEALHLMVGGVLNGPRSALVQLNSVYFPLLFYGRSKVSAQQIKDSTKYTVQSILGSFFEAFGITIRRDADLYQRRKRIFGQDPYTGIPMREQMRMAMADYGTEGEYGTGRRAVRAASVFLSRMGWKSAKSDALYGSFNLFAPFRMTIQGIQDGAILSTWKSYDDLAARAVEYVRANAALSPNDPRSPFNSKFRFTADMLGFSKSALLENQKAFDQMNRFMAEVVGTNLETVAREAYNNQEGQLYSDEQYQKIAQIGLAFITSEGSMLTTRPAGMRTPAMAFMTPLLGWTLQQPNNFSEMFKQPGAGWTYGTILSGMLTFSAAVLPFSLAFSLMMDWYDEYLVGKKSNITPLFGGSVSDMAMSAAERFARWGPMGLPAEAANLFLNVGSSGGDVRDLSLDQRVLFVNSFRGVMQSVGTMLSQNGNVTYASVVRPMLSSMGGNGAMQSLQLFSRAIGDDNGEARVNARTNINNWLRTTGRINGLEVRDFSGAGSRPTPMTPYVTNMLLSAMANDREGFTANYRRAVQEARAMGKEDPVKAVADSYQSRNPLKAIFRSPPTPAEVQKMYKSMSGYGKDAVRDGLRLYNAYGQSLGIAPYFGKKDEGKSKASVFSMGGMFY